MNPRRYVTAAIGVTLCIGCTDPATSPDVARAPIDLVRMFVARNGHDQVQIEFTRKASGSFLVMFEAAPFGRPRVYLDSIGPVPGDPPEIVELLSTFDVWTMADSNAAGASCNTKSGQWVCDIRHFNYTLVLGARRGGVSRDQRYTRLDESVGNKQARALADFVLAWARTKRLPNAQPPFSPSTPRAANTNPTRPEHDERVFPAAARVY